MRQSSSNLAVIAAAGSRKTEQLVETALQIKDGRVLISTYTFENQRQIFSRIHAKAGLPPPNLSVMGWFSFLITQCARPYQRALTGVPGKIRGLNFRGRRNRFTPRANVGRFYFDSGDDLYRDGVSDFVWQANKRTGGAVIARLERIYRHVLVDEVQDLVGYDLDILDLLFNSAINILVVGDPRQHTFATNLGSRNKKYRAAGFLAWLRERENLCALEERNENYRCNQAICDFADRIYPGLPPTKSMRTDDTGHDGVFFIPKKEAVEYFETYRPVVLRDSRRFDTLGLPAKNIGVAKGSTFDRVLIFPTKPMLAYLDHGDPAKLKAPERLYVAVTRACHSVAFVMPQ